MSKKQWIARWSEDQIIDLNQALDAVTGKQNLHKKGRAFPSSPFGLTDDGREDYRGFTLNTTIQYLKTERIDLSYALFAESSLNTSEFTNCCFDGVKLDGRYMTRQFNECSFRGAKLNNARLGERFEDCDFTGCNLSKAIASDATFIRCRFDDVQFRGAMFMHCRFEDCSFEGAKLHHSSFAGSRFSGEAIRLPEWGNTIIEGVKLNGEALGGN
ncbi:pentapeptide repeat-containing protein [Paenibacillus sp. NPDC057967]|uniref:pentapeptide repeat-containing protein n=1 Tax=Paenibacillus sp. NPDC057967 TaxID=3346293 RepID=UPI0036D81E79